MSMSNKDYKPTLAQIRTFVTIAENKHFGAAANKLNISQPSLSQALVALETGLGIQLIERSTRRVLVTPVGEALLPYAKQTLEAADAFYNHARGADGSLTGPLTIGIIPTVAPYVLPNALTALKEEYPELKPRIVEDQTNHLVEALRDGHIDVHLMALPAHTSGLIDIPLYEEPFVLVVPADSKLAGQKNLKVSALNDTELLLLDDGHCLRDQVIDLCRAADVKPGVYSRVTRAASLTTVVQCVANGMGSTLLPVSALHSEIHRPGLAFATFEPAAGARRTIGLVHRSSSSRTAEIEQLGAVFKAAYESVPEKDI